MEEKDTPSMPPCQSIRRPQPFSCPPVISSYDIKSTINMVSNDEQWTDQRECDILATPPKWAANHPSSPSPHPPDDQPSQSLLMSAPAQRGLRTLKYLLKPKYWLPGRARSDHPVPSPREPPIGIPNCDNMSRNRPILSQKCGREDRNLPSRRQVFGDLVGDLRGCEAGLDALVGGGDDGAGDGAEMLGWGVVIVGNGVAVGVECVGGVLNYEGELVDFMRYFVGLFDSVCCLLYTLGAMDRLIGMRSVCKLGFEWGCKAPTAV